MELDKYSVLDEMNMINNQIKKFLPYSQSVTAQDNLVYKKRKEKFLIFDKKDQSLVRKINNRNCERNLKLKDFKSLKYFPTLNFKIKELNKLQGGNEHFLISNYLNSTRKERSLPRLKLKAYYNHRLIERQKENGFKDHSLMEESILKETIEKNTMILKRIHDFIHKTQFNSKLNTLGPEISENYQLSNQTNENPNKFHIIHKFHKIQTNLLNNTMNYANSSKKVKKINPNFKLYDEIDNYMNDSLLSKSKNRAKGKSNFTFCINKEARNKENSLLKIIPHIKSDSKNKIVSKYFRSPKSQILLKKVFKINNKIK